MLNFNLYIFAHIYNDCFSPYKLTEKHTKGKLAPVFLSNDNSRTGDSRIKINGLADRYEAEGDN